MAFRTMLGARSTFVARWYRSSLATRGPSPLCATPSHSIRRTASLPTMLRKMMAPLRGMIVLHDHSRDSAAAAMSSAAWIPWPRSLALASLGRTSGPGHRSQHRSSSLRASSDAVVTLSSLSVRWQKRQLSGDRCALGPLEWPNRPRPGTASTLSRLHSRQHRSSRHRYP